MKDQPIFMGNPDRCSVCSEPATVQSNVTASAASSVPSVMEPRCRRHDPYDTAGTATAGGETQG